MVQIVKKAKLMKKTKRMEKLRANNPIDRSNYSTEKKKRVNYLLKAKKPIVKKKKGIKSTGNNAVNKP